jgi:hypothetical protein
MTTGFRVFTCAQGRFLAVDESNFAPFEFHFVVDVSVNRR